MKPIESGIIWVMLATLFVMTAFAVIKVTDVQGHQNDALHSIICYVEYRQLQSPTITDAEKRQSVLFWKAALKRAALPPCAPVKVPARTTTTTPG